MDKNKFFMFFGAFWELIVSIILFVFYEVPNGTITVNGKIVSQAEFNSLLWPKLIFLIFILVGLFFVVIGIIGLIKDNKINELGKEYYGKIIDIHNNDCSINGRCLEDAKVKVYIEELNEIKEYTEHLELHSLYREKDYIKVKYYNNDINIIDTLEEIEIPSNIKELLDKE